MMWLVILVVCFLLKYSYSQKVFGNSLYLWGCNQDYMLGRESPFGRCDVSDWYRNILGYAELLENPGPLNGMTFKLICHTKINNVVVTTDNKVYVWGGNYYKITPNVSFVPSLLFDRQISEIECGHESVIFKNILNELFGWGNNKYGELGIGDQTFREYPKFISEDVEFFSAGMRTTGVKKFNDENVYIGGDNHFYQLGFPGLPTTHQNLYYKAINMSVISLEKAKAIQLYIYDFGVVYLFNNSIAYIWGCFQTHSLSGIMESSDCSYPSPNPVKVDFKKYLSPGDKVISITGMTAVYVFFYNASMNSNWVMSYGCSDGFPGGWCNSWRLGRPLENWHLPLPVDRGEVPHNESVIMVGTFWYTTYIITDNGRLYAFGLNYFFGILDHSTKLVQVDIYRTKDWPIRIIEDDNTFTGVAKNGFHFHVFGVASYKCEGKLPSAEGLCYGRGYCIGEDICQCYDGFTGDLCDEYVSCNGILGNYSTVCSGHGVCYASEKCECENGFFGHDCQIDYSCFSMDPTSHMACGGAGNCLSDDNCMCTRANFFGEECRESVLSAKFTTYTHEEFRVSYVAPTSYLTRSPNDYDGEFGCSNVIDSPLIGSATCLFEYTGVETTGLLVRRSMTDYSWNVYIGSTINVRSITVHAETITVTIEASEGYNPIDASQFWWIFPLVIVIVLISTLVIVIIVIIIIVIVVIMKKKEGGKLKDIELPIEELVKKVEIGNMEGLDINWKVYTLLFDKVIQEKQIWTGKHGSTLVKSSHKDADVMLKIFPTKYFKDQKMYNEFERAIRIAQSMKHPHVVKFIGAVIKPPRIGVVFEWCASGSLHSYIKYTNKDIREPFSMADKLRIFCECAEGISYIHENNIYFGDLKLENVMLQKGDSVRLVDYQISKIFAKANVERERNVHNIFTAPEITLGKTVDFRCDSFSFAMIVYMVFLDTLIPYGDNPGADIAKKIANDNMYRPEMNDRRWEKVPWLKVIIIDNLCGEREERSSFVEIVKSLKSGLERFKSGTVNGEEKKPKKEEKIEKVIKEKVEVQNDPMVNTKEEEPKKRVIIRRSRPGMLTDKKISPMPKDPQMMTKRGSKVAQPIHAFKDDPIEEKPKRKVIIRKVRPGMLTGKKIAPMPKMPQMMTKRGSHTTQPVFMLNDDPVEKKPTRRVISRKVRPGMLTGKKIPPMPKMPQMMTKRPPSNRK